MRKLRIVIGRSTRALPALLAAALVPAAADCAGDDETPTNIAAGSVGSGVGGDGGAPSATTITGFTVTTTTTTTTGGVNWCGGVTQTITVEIPPEGVPASQGQICAVMPPPVESNGAARVTLIRDPAALHLATGHVEIASTLAGFVIGQPTIEVAGGAPELAGMQVTAIVPVAGGFDFQAEWPADLMVSPQPWMMVTVKVTFEIPCDMMGNTTFVEAITHINLCIDDDGDLGWVSSGDPCKACDIIAEMAPSPIVSDKAFDELPLAGVLRLRLVPLARIGRRLVLLAENDGGEGLEYAWEPSAGRIAELGPDVVVWDLPAERGPHLIQAVVQGADAAAVASFVWQEVA